MELLSPAGNRDALLAAISCGADAVYLGYTAFGARSYAGNFDADGLNEAVQYAHERGKKIYVTVNTLVKQAEVDDLCDVLELLCRIGADAVLVQDMGVVRIARERFPELTLHASTQMTVNNAQGARLMKELGFSRVVPARECSLAELRCMADTGVEVEAFAHGALCVAVSGQCLFSSMIGGRSGNRGRCAQPCRLPYTLQDGTCGYLLSTRDLMLLDRLPQLRDAGVYSFKLEGRMKRPEYVGIVTRAYREALDAAEAHVPYHPGRAVQEALRQIFNRGGFTEGYAMGKSHAALMSWERPNHEGIRVGKVTAMRGPLASVLLERDLHDGDGLQIRGRKETDLTYSGHDTRAGKEATVRIASAEARPGDRVYRLTDAAQMREIREYIAQEHVHIPLKAVLRAIPGERPALTLCDMQGHSVTAYGDQPVVRAERRALEEGYARRQIDKTGGTPYSIESFSLKGENAFMTAAMLNGLRRDALGAMRMARTTPERRKREGKTMPCVLPAPERLLIAQGEDLSACRALLSAGADVFYWQPQDYRPGFLEGEMANAPQEKPILVMPAVAYTQELEALHAFVCRHARRIGGVVLSNVGQFGCEWPVPIYGGQELNVMNGDCAKFYTALGARRLTASCELSAREWGQLFEAGGNYEIEVYGRTRLMLLSHCPRRTRAGDEKQDASCNACAAQGGCPDIYTDRKGYRFPLRRIRMEHGCVLRLYNSVVTDMARHGERIARLGCSLRLVFTQEPLRRQEEIVASYRSLMDTGRPLHRIDDDATAGHLLRGVE